MTDMLVRLYDLPEAGPLVKGLADHGMVIRRAMPYEKHLVVDWVQDSFGDGWAAECDVAFSNHPVSCFVATEAGDIIGFACHDSICVNFFGPIGVAEKKRGLGIGKALFLSCLHAMGSHGYAYAIIGGVGPTAFYADTVGAVPIAGSSPGIYRDPLRKQDAWKRHLTARLSPASGLQGNEMSPEPIQRETVGAGLLLRAVEFSAEKHRGQRRKGVDATPYINHPIEVATMLANVAGVRNLATLIAAVLHDTIEDTHASPEELEAVFGPEIRLLVQEVTDDKSLPKAERKRLQVEHAPQLSPSAKLIKLADKVSNVRDVTDRPPSDWSVERRREYLEWAERVVVGCRGVNSTLESRFEETLRRARQVISPEA